MRSGSTVTQPTEPDLALLAGGGAMGARMRAHDWSATPLGRPEAWPQPLRTLVGVMLAANQPMFVAWGLERVTLYNDAYADILAHKHPAALGRPFHEVWSEIWDELEPIMGRAYAGEPIHMDDITLVMHRRGYPEEAHFAFSYTPVRAESGGIAGVFCVCTETTAQVVAERQRSESETALRESEARWRGLFERMHEGFFVGEAIRDARGRMQDFRFIEVNPAVEALIGIPAACMIGRSVREVVPGIQDEVIETYARVVETGEPAQFEVSIPVLHERWYEARARKTNAERFAVLFLEITERKRAEDALQASETRLQFALEAGRLGTWELDLTTDTAERSRRHDQIFGYEEPVSAWGYRIFSQHVLAEDREAVDRAFRKAIETRTEWRFQCRIRRAGDGEVRWIEASGAPFRSVDGRVTHMLGIVADVTERKREQEALRESEARFGAIVDQASVGISQSDLSGRFILANERYCEIVGRSADELYSLRRQDITHPDDLPAYLPLLERAIETGEPFAIDKRYVRPDGSHVWVSGSVYPLLGPDGKPRSLVAATVDITDRKRAEEHRELLLAELSHRVKNTLATVQSIAAQTLRTAASPEAFRHAFEARLLALSQTHNLLSRRNWEGAALRDVLMAELTPHLGSGQSGLSVDGPEVQLGPRATLALGMAFHELATNAAKYGALSVPTGRLDISWHVAAGPKGECLHLRWLESGGPPVAPPTRRGFGSTLIERGLAHELDGEVDLAFEPAGVRCTMTIPLAGL